jgi:hypothetical protein
MTLWRGLLLSEVQMRGYVPSDDPMGLETFRGSDDGSKTTSFSCVIDNAGNKWQFPPRSAVASEQRPDHLVTEGGGRAGVSPPGGGCVSDLAGDLIPAHLQRLQGK